MSAIAGRARQALVTLTGTGAGASGILALLVFACVFVGVLTPRMSLNLRTAALHTVVAAMPQAERAVTASIDLPTYAQAANASGFAVVGASDMQGSMAELAASLRAAGLPLHGSASWWGLSTGFMTVTAGGRHAYFGDVPPRLELLDRAGLGREVSLVAGELPAADHLGAGSALFQVAVTPTTAARFGLHVGSALRIDAGLPPGQGERITVVVSGIVSPVHPSSSFWSADPDAAAATFTATAIGGAGYWTGAAFLSDSEFAVLQAVIGQGSMSATWEFPLALGGMTANQAGALSADLAAALRGGGLLTTSVAVPVTVPLTSGLAEPLAGFVGLQSQLASLLALLYVSLTVAGFVVVLLGAWLLAERRAAEHRLIRARGAGRWQLARRGLAAGAVVVVPAAVAGAAVAAAVTRGADEPLAWWLAAGTALAALVAVPVAAVRLAPAGTAGDRADSPQVARARQTVVDVTLVLAALGGLIVLRLHGPAAPGRTDWYTSAVPVLVAAPAAVAALRCYPAVARWLVRRSGRARAAAAFVGLARAARTSRAAALPVFALVLVLAMISFGAMIRAAVLSGDVAQSWRAAGADAVIDAAGSAAPLGPATQRVIEGLPGVRRTAALSVQAGLAADGTALAVVVVDPASYGALIADTPARRFPAAALRQPAGPSAILTGGLPALATPAAAAALAHTSEVVIWNRQLRLHVAGRIGGLPGVPGTSPILVLPSWAVAGVGEASQARPNLMLIVGSGLDRGRLGAVVKRLLPGAAVTYRARLLAGLTDAPLPHGAYLTFAIGIASAAIFGGVIVAIMLALGARPRELTVARLRTMGLSAGQARRLVIAEALPPVLAAAAGGAVSAWVLVPLIGPGIDLAPFTGSSAAVHLRADLAVIGYVAACLLVLASGVVLAHTATTRLRGVAHALRVGE